MKSSIQFHYVVWLLICTAFLSNCGIRVLYNHMDWIIPYYIGDYITLNEKQKNDLEKQIAVLMKWHRKTQLRKYAAFLRSTSRIVDQKINREHLDEIFLIVDANWKNLVQEITPALVEFLLNVNNNQKLELFKKIEKDNEEFVINYRDVDEQEFKEKQSREVQESFERWIGRLNSNQEYLIKQHSNKLISLNKERYRFRRLWQKQFHDSMYSNASKSHNRQRITQLFTNSSALHSAEYKSNRLYNRSVIKELILKLAPTLSAKQRNHLQEQIEEYASTFDDLAAVDT